MTGLSFDKWCASRNVNLFGSESQRAFFRSFLWQAREAAMNRSAKELAGAIGARGEGDGTLELGGGARPGRARRKGLIYPEAAQHPQPALPPHAKACIA